MKVFGHDHIAVDDEPIFAASLIENLQKKITPTRGEIRLPAIAAASDEMEIIVAIEAMQASCHRARVICEARACL